MREGVGGGLVEGRGGTMLGTTPRNTRWEEGTLG